MAEEYLDFNGNPLKEGWCILRGPDPDGFTSHLFFIEKIGGKFIASDPYRKGIRISSKIPYDPDSYASIHPKRLYPTTSEANKICAQKTLDFINEKQSKLEQLAKSKAGEPA